MKPPITSAQVKSQRFFETINSLGKMADELRAEVEALTKERDIAVRKLSALSSAHALENLYQAGLDQEREITRLKKERDALAEQVSLLKTTNEVLAEKLAAAEIAHLHIRTQSLNDAANLCEGEKWCNSGDKSVKYIDAYNDGCAACGAAIRRLK